ncbi:hypothetical protein NUW58_g9047 [Xylaria curta]|uniref:Uncharacterized protein n=1 Tax=Xylaria curta TaxID=42375 RepID=A0ACC1N195_9PEZI|nr:hypothetical protein NUW58_g9047 [Xylaria curta]
MSSLRHVSRSTTPASIARTPSLAVLSYSRAPAYRRLISSALSPARRDAAFSTPSRMPTAFLPLLRSPFLPETVAAIQSRSFHVTLPWYQEQPAQPEKPSKPEQKSDESASSSESEAKPEAEEQKKQQEESEDSGEGKKEEEKGEKKEDLPPPPPHGDKTPWQVFMETMQTEFKASKEWNESTKQLSDSAHQFTESESVRRARQAYESTTGAVSSTAGRVLKTSADVVGKGAAWTWDTNVMKGVRKGANITGEALDKATKPIRDTEAFKSVKDVIDDGSSSRYGGWVEKEERRKARELRQKKAAAIHGNVEEMVEDPNAGTNVTLHKDAAWKEAWRDFRDQNKFVQGVFNMKSVYQESENPLVSTARSITDRVAGFFAENETAMVIKKIRAMDPSFQIEPFQQELRDYILPEVLDAYVKGDTETLKLWLSAAQYSVYEALTKQYLQAGMKSDGRILDIRHVDILKARMLEPGEIPVFIITCRTQEVHVYRNAKTSELAAGMEDRVQLVTYVIGITRTPEDVNNPETRGWRYVYKLFPCSPTKVVIRLILTIFQPLSLSLLSKLLAHIHQTLTQKIHPPLMALRLGALGREADAPDPIEGARLDELAVARSQQDIPKACSARRLRGLPMSQSPGPERTILSISFPIPILVRSVFDRQTELAPITPRQRCARARAPTRSAQSRGRPPQRLHVPRDAASRMVAAISASPNSSALWCIM